MIPMRIQLVSRPHKCYIYYLLIENQISMRIFIRNDTNSKESTYLGARGARLVGDELGSSTSDVGSRTGLDELEGKILIEGADGSTAADVKSAALGGDKGGLGGGANDGEEGAEEGEDLHGCWGKIAKQRKGGIDYLWSV